MSRKKILFYQRRGENREREERKRASKPAHTKNEQGEAFIMVSNK